MITLRSLEICKGIKTLFNIVNYCQFYTKHNSPMKLLIWSESIHSDSLFLALHWTNVAKSVIIVHSVQSIVRRVPLTLVQLTTPDFTSSYPFRGSRSPSPNHRVYVMLLSSQHPGPTYALIENSPLLQQDPTSRF